MTYNFPESFRSIITDNRWEKEYIGAGNPNAKILIIGQEVAYEEGSREWQDFYVENHRQWYETYKNGYTYHTLPAGVDVEEYKFPEYYNPINPFWHKTMTSCWGRGRTWYWYQKLVDGIIYKDVDRNPEFIDFFDNAFITELNNHTLPDHKSMPKEIGSWIADRFDFLKATSDFWSGFDHIIIAAGSYSDALKTNSALCSAIFADKEPVFCSQLSGWQARKNVLLALDGITK